MVLPFFAFTLGLLVFGALAFVVLGFGKVAPVRPLTITAFVVGAFVATPACVSIYRQYFTQTSHLGSRQAIFIFFGVTLIVATSVGALAAPCAPLPGGR